MSPRYLRYRFPSEHAAESAGLPVESARALASLFLAVPADRLNIAHLDAIATGWATVNTDAGALEYASGEAMGEQLSPWLRLVVSPGGRRAYLDVDLEALGLVMRQQAEGRG